MSVRGVSVVPNQISGEPIAGFTAISQIFSRDFSMTAGDIPALVGALVTVTLNGLLITDQVLVQCRGTMTPGAIIANAKVVSTNTLEITFVTAVALGVTLGALTYRVTVFR